MRSVIEQYMQWLWYQAPRYAALPLLGLTPLYALGAGWMRWCQKQLYYPVSKPVVVAGNLTLGGTGKTPLVIALSEQFKRRGYKPGIICRAYRGANRLPPQVVELNADPAKVGDEAVLLGRRADCPVVVAADRQAALHHILYYDKSLDLVIADDGLQNYLIPHDLKIIVIDGARRFGNGFLLPAGPLREPLRRLSDADFRVANGQARTGEFEMKLQPTALVNCASHQRIPPLQWQEREVHACAGIGNPERFFKALDDCGMAVQRHVFPDHHSFSPEDLRFPDNRAVVITEKDAVKCRGFADNNVWCLEVQAEVGDDFYDAFFERFEGIIQHYG